MAQNAHTTAEVHHEGGHSAAFPPFDSSTFASQILWLAITFGLFYVLMAKVALPRIGGILEARHDKIAADLEEANRLKADSEAAGAAYETALAAARKKAHDIASETRAALTASIDAERHSAEEKLAAEIAAALRNPSAAQGQFGNLIFGFAVTEALGIFSLLVALILLFA